MLVLTGEAGIQAQREVTEEAQRVEEQDVEHSTMKS